MRIGVVHTSKGALIRAVRICGNPAGAGSPNLVGADGAASHACGGGVGVNITTILAQVKVGSAKRRDLRQSLVVRQGPCFAYAGLLVRRPRMLATADAAP